MRIELEDVVGARNGDRSSFERVYEGTAPDLYKYALYTLGNPQDAEDVVSETFVEAYKGLKNLRDETRFKPWIMKILSIRCKRKIAQYIQGKNLLDIDSARDLFDLSENHVEKTEVLAALENLQTEERQIVILSVLQGYTTKEIASILSCPQGTVSSKLHRSLKKLRVMLGN